MCEGAEEGSGGGGPEGASTADVGAVCEGAEEGSGGGGGARLWWWWGMREVVVGGVAVGCCAVGGGGGGGGGGGEARSVVLGPNIVGSESGNVDEVGTVIWGTP